MTDKNLKMVEEIKEEQETKEAVEQPVVVTEVEEEVKEGKLDKVKGFAKKHWKAIAGAVAVGTAAALVARASKKDDIIEGEYEEIMEDFEYDKDYADREEVKEDSDTKVEEEA